MPAAALQVCRICGTRGDHPVYAVREMMFGTREVFDYFQCASCGCLQIGEVPQDLGRHYPSNYYSRSLQLPPLRQSRGLKLWFRRTRNDGYFTGRGLGGLLNRLRPLEEHTPGYLKRLRLGMNSAILDVGCGNGALLIKFRNLGYAVADGLDPFMEQDLFYPNGVRIYKRSLDQHSGAYDLVMFHHSFEHLADQEGSLRHTHRLLKPGGACIIRVPTVSSWAWEHYREHWVQLDAPRHLFLHSYKSLRLLAEKTGFDVPDIHCDSNELQFWGSEQYRQDISRVDGQSYETNPSASGFTAGQIESFKTRAGELNREGRGDQFVATLIKKEGLS